MKNVDFSAQVTPTQPYTPERAYDAQRLRQQQFLAIDESLTQSLEIFLYNSGNSGWSYGKDMANGQHGWFPTSSCSFDVVTTM